MLNGLGIDETFLIIVLGVLFVSPKQLAQLIHWFRTTKRKLTNYRYEFEDKVEKLVNETIDPDSVPRVKAPTKEIEAEISNPPQIKETRDEKELKALENESLEKQKNTTRKIAQNRLHQLLADERIEYSEKLIKNILRWDSWIQSKKVAFYMPIQNEVDLIPLIKIALKENKEVYLPYINNENDFIGLAKIENLEQDTVLGLFNILEPREDLRQALDPEEIELFLVPGIAFGESGQRLGRGKGYYDRLLSRFSQSTKCGIAYDFQIFEGTQLPQRDLDIAMNVVFTEVRMIKCGRKT